MSKKDVHIGVILVHGIGEHRRFEHLDGELRPLIKAMVRRANVTPSEEDPDTSRNVTVEIIGGGEATLHADQDTWSTASGAPVRIVVRDGGIKKHIHVHEVWWADVNEPYSFWKQVRFWIWGLSIWNIPPKLEFDLPGARATMELPKFPPEEVERPWRLRSRLFLVSNVFAMAAFSLGALLFFAKRLLGFAAPSIVRIFVNYIGAVKLYSQRRRIDGGFLDAFTEPPRVSIRRRMIRTIADVALANYDRWYVIAHSLGSVVAYNGLNENAHAIPNYLSEKQYGKLVGGIDNIPFAGDGRDDIDHVGNTKDMLPARPVWLKNNAVVYRDKLYIRFRGLLTYGSPLDKFAAIWPARVPINKCEAGPVLTEHANRAEWINVYDPTDPVGGKIDAFGKPTGIASDIVLEPCNFAYASHPLLLYSHLKYFDKGKDRSRLADRLVEWILTGDDFSKPPKASSWLWLDVNSFPYRLRRAGAWLTWVLVYLLLTFLGALSLPLWRSLFVGGGGTVVGKINEIWRDTFVTPSQAVSAWPWLDTPLGWIEDLVSIIYQYLIAWWWDWAVVIATVIWSGVVTIAQAVVELIKWFDAGLIWFAQKLSLPVFGTDMLRLMVYVALVTGIVGILMRWGLSRGDPRPPEGASSASPGLSGQTISAVQVEHDKAVAGATS